MTLPERFWECRDYGHAWKVAGVAVHKNSPLQYVRLFVCLRKCDTTRKEVISSGGVKRSRSYDYDDEYQLHGDEVLQRDKLIRQARIANLKDQLR